MGQHVSGALRRAVQIPSASASLEGNVIVHHDAFEHLRSEKHIAIVPGASHLFEEPGTLETAAALAAEWFRRHLERRH